MLHEPSLTTIDGIVQRLHTSQKGRIRPEKTANDSMVSDLPSETLRWMKKRRSQDSDKKVVLPHYKERMLREIFNGIDVGKHGVIHLDEICEACEFVQAKLKNVKGLEKFQNIQAVFRGMDDNGDGTIDFHEFTSAMSGSKNSAFEGISDMNIDKLYKCFVDYGVYAHRRKANSSLQDYLGYEVTKETHKLTRLATFSHLPPANPTSSDAACYDYFKTLFGQEGNTFTKVSYEKVAEEQKSLRMAEKMRVEYQEALLDDFIENNLFNPEVVLNDPEKELAYHHIQSKLKQYRKSQLQMKADDPDAVAAEVRLLEEKKHMQESKARRPHTAGGAGNGGRRSAADDIKKTTKATVTLVPVDLDARGDQQLKLSAKREAYDILKRSGEYSPRGNPIPHVAPRKGTLTTDDGSLAYTTASSKVTGRSSSLAGDFSSVNSIAGASVRSSQSTIKSAVLPAYPTANGKRLTSARGPGRYSAVVAMAPIHLVDDFHH